MAAEGPIRTCVGCRTRRPQTDLIRLRLDGAGRVVVDRHGPGRGAWLCAASPAACLDAGGERSLVRALRQRPATGSVAALVEHLRDDPEDGTGS